MLKLKALLSKILSWAGLKYDWSYFNTTNTTDTWVPVTSAEKVYHRVIPAMIGTRISPTIVLANSNVETVTASSVECVQLNGTEYLCEFTVRLTTTTDRINLPACQFRYGGKVLTPKANCHNFPAHIGSAYGGGWWNGSWLCFSGTWGAKTTGEMYGSFIGELK